uniref:Ribosomal RNA processing 1 n=1 Tax=Mus musculus TaxID=10090 RepID=A0A1W2P7C5_MOUSE
MVPGVPLPPEIQLAQRLAGNEQVTRDRALRKLRKYIEARSQRATGRTRKDHCPACPCFSHDGGTAPVPEGLLADHDPGVGGH